MGWFTGELKRTCYFWVTKNIKNIDYIFAFDCLFYTKLFFLTSTQCSTGKGVDHFRLWLHIPHKDKLLELSSPVCDLRKTTYLLVNFWHASWTPVFFCFWNSHLAILHMGLKLHSPPKSLNKFDLIHICLLHSHGHRVVLVSATPLETPPNFRDKERGISNKVLMPRMPPFPPHLILPFLLTLRKLTVCEHEINYSSSGSLLVLFLFFLATFSCQICLSDRSRPNTCS